MASITEADVLHVAGLARLTLTRDEVASLREELGAILKHVEQLDELDTENLSAADTAGPHLTPLADDTVRPGLDQQRALSEAPRTSQGGFAVPAFVDD